MLPDIKDIKDNRTNIGSDLMLQWDSKTVEMEDDILVF